jgi:hypothetical protein
MLRTVDEIRTQITPNLQRFLNDMLIDDNDPRPLMFGDEQEFKTIKGMSFPTEMNACLNPFLDRFIIFIKRIDKIGIKEQDDIAHELGHLWLLFLGLPSEKKSSDGNRQASWETFFSPLRDTMEHAVYYPLIKDKYQIDLYKIGNERLSDFITNQLPTLGNESTPAKLLLVLNYIKYEVEADDPQRLESLHKAYSTKSPDVKNIADSVLLIVKELAGTKNPKNFIAQYCAVLRILDAHFGIPAEQWPYFCGPNK